MLIEPSQYIDPNPGINFQITSGTYCPSTHSSHLWKPPCFRSPNDNDLFISSVPQCLWANLLFRRFINIINWLTVLFLMNHYMWIIFLFYFCLQDEDASPLLTQTRKATHHALLTSVPYKGYKSTSTTVQGQTFSEKRRSFFQTVFANSLQGGVWLPSAPQKQALPGNGGSSINTQSSETPCAGYTTRDELKKNIKI